MRRCWRSAIRSAPASTSSPMARCGARAIPTVSRRRSTASISTIPDRRRRARRAAPSRCRASSGRFAAGKRSRRATSQFLRANTSRRSRSPCPAHSPCRCRRRTIITRTRVALAMDYAAAVNEEIKDLFAAGADVVQIDEPYMQARPDKAARIRRESAQPRARWRHRHDRGASLLRLRGFREAASRGLFLPAGAREFDRGCRSRSRPRSPQLDCAVLEKLPSKQIVLGVIDLANTKVESPATVAARIRRALPYVPRREARSSRPIAA